MRLTTRDGLGLHVQLHGASNDELPLICLHGLTRNADDFDDLAACLADEYPLIAIDFRGRARSDYDADFRNYVPRVYARDVLDVLNALHIERAVFCGTSLGGIVTMLVAEAQRSLVAGAILNDIGPIIEPDGLARIQSYTGKLEPPTDWDAARDQMKAVYGETLTDLTDSDFDRLCQRTYNECDNGELAFAYDPAIGTAIREVGMEIDDPWSLFLALKGIPTLVLRGEHSDILSDATVAEMARRHGGLVKQTIRHRGHVPLLDEDDSVKAIRAFLAGVQK